METQTNTEQKRDKQFNEDIKEIELNQLAILTEAKIRESKGQYKLTDDMNIMFKFLSNKYPSDSFFLFNYYSGFF
jgi:hypothetical protein